jgi:cytoskeletal protein CcmA (bactofilin family)
MESANRGDLTINGFGASNGGEFNRVILNGKGTVNSDLECNEFYCNGSGIVNGNLQTKSAKISGNGKIAGNVTSGTLSIEGRGKIENNVSAKKVKVSGRALIGGNLKSEEIRVKGRIKIEGDCEAEAFKAESQFTIGGLLNAEQIDVLIYGECRAEEIGGQTITIKQKSSFIGNLFKPFFQNVLETELIEGDHIEIENTNAKIVRGSHVTIGQNCKIGLVEYTGTYNKDKKAIVNDSCRI